MCHQHDSERSPRGDSPDKPRHLHTTPILASSTARIYAESACDAPEGQRIRRTLGVQARPERRLGPNSNTSFQSHNPRPCSRTRAWGPVNYPLQTRPSPGTRSFVCLDPRALEPPCRRSHCSRTLATDVRRAMTVDCFSSGRPGMAWHAWVGLGSARTSHCLESGVACWVHTASSTFV